MPIKETVKRKLLEENDSEEESISNNNNLSSDEDFMPQSKKSKHVLSEDESPPIKKSPLKADKNSSHVKSKSSVELSDAESMERELSETENSPMNKASDDKNMTVVKSCHVLAVKLPPDITERAMCDEKQGDESSDEEPLSKIVKSSDKKKVSIFDESEDEPLAGKSKIKTSNSLDNSGKSEGNGMGSSENEEVDSDFEPLEKSKRASIISDNSDDDDVPLAVKSSTKSGSKLLKSQVLEKEDSEISEVEEDVSSEDEELQNLKSAKKVSDDSEDEPLAVKCKQNASKKRQQHKKAEKESPESSQSGDDSDYEPLAAKSKAQQSKNARKRQPESSKSGEDESLEDSDFEPLAAKHKAKTAHKLQQSKNAGKRHLEQSRSGHEESSSDDEPLKSLATKKQESKKVSTSEDDVPAVPKSKKDDFKNSDKPLKKTNSSNDSFDLSSDDESVMGPKKAKSTKKVSTYGHEPVRQKSKKDHLQNSDRKKFESSADDSSDHSSPDDESVQNFKKGKPRKKVILSDDEPLSVISKRVSLDKPPKAKKAAELKSKSSPKNDVSDEDKPLVEVLKTKEKMNKISASEKKLENMKKFLRVAGMKIRNYNTFFENSKSMKAKIEKLLELLHEKGLKGRPTLEKCKKLKIKLETKKEIAELDFSNIIQTEGRPKRGSPSNLARAGKMPPDSPPQKKFSRLKEIVDSEGSDE